MLFIRSYYAWIVGSSAQDTWPVALWKRRLMLNPQESKFSSLAIFNRRCAMTGWIIKSMRDCSRSKRFTVYTGSCRLFGEMGAYMWEFSNIREHLSAAGTVFLLFRGAASIKPCRGLGVFDINDTLGRSSFIYVKVSQTFFSGANMFYLPRSITEGRTRTNPSHCKINRFLDYVNHKRQRLRSKALCTAGGDSILCRSPSGLS